MKKITLTFTLVVANLLIVCGDCLAVTRNINVGSFTSLKVVDDLNVVFSNAVDSVDCVQFDDKDIYSSAIMVSHEKETLEIQVAPEYADMKDLPTVYVYGRNLKFVSNEGDSIVRVISPIRGENFRVRTWANGKIIVSDVDVTKAEAQISTGKGMIVLVGKAETASYSCTGAGEIQADKLLVPGKVQCRFVGTGTIGCNVSGELVVRGSGTGKVYYCGHPTSVSKKTLGPIKAISLDEDATTSSN